MLPVELLVSFLLAAFTASSLVLAAPSPFYTVELMTCGQSPNGTASRCGDVCEPVTRAQSLCEGLPYCTCTTAPADTIQACLQCHIEDEMHRYIGDLRLEVPPKLQTYASMCDNILSTRSLQSLPELQLPPENPKNETLDRREQSVCVYGLPDVTLFPSSSLSSYQSPWFLFAFVVVAGVSILQIRRKSNSNTSNSSEEA
ncbi:hypothetical protein EIP91_004428 [Steccherinum ochraceum]|uniref:Extracellular membrane protein CFEM domain-containing protein n=1 Tax=Steccherinum ochraceum TaxID=92696 RepID=A0A4R0RF10_9APHY|nr:hypothetical protein EIP91_004428 [Steccherinum ochraceum]